MVVCRWGVVVGELDDVIRGEGVVGDVMATEKDEREDSGSRGKGGLVSSSGEGGCVCEKERERETTLISIGKHVQAAIIVSLLMQKSIS